MKTGISVEAQVCQIHCKHSENQKIGVSTARVSTEFRPGARSKKSVIFLDHSGFIRIPRKAPRLLNTGWRHAQKYSPKPRVPPLQTRATPARHARTTGRRRRHFLAFVAGALRLSCIFLSICASLTTVATSSSNVTRRLYSLRRVFSSQFSRHHLSKAVSKHHEL